MFVVPDEIICCCYQVVKNSSASAGDARDLGFISEFGKIPLGRKWQPAPVFLPGKLCGQRSLAGYGPWGHQESDMTEQLSTHTKRSTSDSLVMTF